jgi:hypothetical protein
MSRDRTVSAPEGDHDPTAERSDPRCPSCGEKVGARAQYCIHCWRDLPERDVHDYDEVTGGTHEVSHEREAVTTETDAVTTETGEVSAGTPTVGDEGGGPLERLRAATAGDGSNERDRDVDAPPVPSGLGSDGPSFLPAPPGEWERAGVFLGGVAVVGGLATVVGGFEPVTAGALAAFAAWAVSTAWLGRARSWFDAMRYGSFNLVSTLVFASFGLSMAADGAGRFPLALTLVPVAVSTLLVAGLGDTVADYSPGPA